MQFSFHYCLLEKKEKKFPESTEDVPNENHSQDSIHTSVGASVYSLTRSTATMLVSSSQVMRTIQFNVCVTWDTSHFIVLNIATHTHQKSLL